MARLSCVALFIALNVFVCVFAEEEHYPNTYDNIDIRAVLQDDVIREQFYKCFMELDCKTPAQTLLTGIFSEAYQTQCKKCTEKQKEMIDMVADWWTKNDPEKWKLIVAKTVEDMKKKNGGQLLATQNNGTSNMLDPDLSN